MLLIISYSESAYLIITNRHWKQVTEIICLFSLYNLNNKLIVNKIIYLFTYDVNNKNSNYYSYLSLFYSKLVRTCLLTDNAIRY